MTFTVYAEELQYVGGGSDKYYRVYTFAGSNIWAIQYGRNGTYGTFSRKVAESPREAETAADKQVQAKYSKGYEPRKSLTLDFASEPTDAQLDTAMKGPGGPAVTDKDISGALKSFSKIIQDTDDEPNVARFEELMKQLTATYGPFSPGPLPTGSKIRPMLADTVDPRDVESLLTDDRWVMQTKLDGERFVIEVDEGRVAVYNRQGQPKTSNIVPEVLAPFYDLVEGYWVFDGELIGRSLWLFDMPAAGGFLHKEASFEDRYEMLARTLTNLQLLDGSPVGLVPNAIDTEQKRLMLKQAQDEQREGVILRKLSARYQFGRRTLDLLKHKFIKEADVFVTQVGVKGKDNAELAVYKDYETVVVGQASTIGKGDIKVGDVLEVKFLYVLDAENPRLYQPRILRKRTDKSAEECSFEQFRNAGTNKEI